MNDLANKWAGKIENVRRYTSFIPQAINSFEPFPKRLAFAPVLAHERADISQVLIVRVKYERLPAEMISIIESAQPVLQVTDVIGMMNHPRRVFCGDH